MGAISNNQRERYVMGVIRAAVQAAPERGGVAFVLDIAARAYEIVDTMYGSDSRTAELAALREQVRTARLDGAREAWRIARANVSASVEPGDYCCCPPFYEDWDDANAVYLDTFGEEAP